jgi:predicted RNase H-like HicB family nuclease
MSTTVSERELTPEELAEARRYALVIEWSPEDGAFVVSVPDIPGIHTHGETRVEAAEMGDQVVALWSSARRRSGRPSQPPAFQARFLTSQPATSDAAERALPTR